MAKGRFLSRMFLAAALVAGGSDAYAQDASNTKTSTPTALIAKAYTTPTAKKTEPKPASPSKALKKAATEPTTREFRMDLIPAKDHPKGAPLNYISATVTEGDNYAIYDLHDPTSTHAGIIGPLELSVTLRMEARARGEPAPYVIFNYYGEDAEGKVNYQSFNQISTIMWYIENKTKESLRPIVIINAPTLRLDKSNEITSLYLGAMIYHLDNNNGLGKGDTHLDNAEKHLDKLSNNGSRFMTFPYSRLTDENGKMLRGLAWSLFQTDKENPENGFTQPEISNYFMRVLSDYKRRANIGLTSSAADNVLALTNG